MEIRAFVQSIMTAFVLGLCKGDPALPTPTVQFARHGLAKAIQQQLLEGLSLCR